MKAVLSSEQARLKQPQQKYISWADNVQCWIEADHRDRVAERPEWALLRRASGINERLLL